MILLYTGAQSPGSQQPESLKSLGGYISSSQVFNIDQNLFNDIEIPENKFIGTRMLCLKNTFAQKTEELGRGMTNVNNPIFFGAGLLLYKTGQALKDKEEEKEKEDE